MEKIDQKVLDLIPSEEEFLKFIKEKNYEAKYIVPYLNQLHKVIHEILPKPNQVFYQFIIF